MGLLLWPSVKPASGRSLSLVGLLLWAGVEPASGCSLSLGGLVLWTIVKMTSGRSLSLGGLLMRCQLYWSLVQHILSRFHNYFIVLGLKLIKRSSS